MEKALCSFHVYACFNCQHRSGQEICNPTKKGGLGVGDTEDFSLPGLGCSGELKPTCHSSVNFLWSLKEHV